MNKQYKRLIMATWFAIISFPLFASVQVSLSKANGKPGQEVEISVSVTNDETLTGLQLLFEVPAGSGLTLPSATTTGRASTFSASTGIRNGRASLILYQTNGSTLTAGSGEVARLRIKFGNQPIRTTIPVTVKATHTAGTVTDCKATPLQLACRQAKAEYTTKLINFGRFPLNTQPVQTLTISNTGTIPLIISETIYSHSEFTTLTSLPLIIEPQTVGTLEVKLNPTERGEISSVLNLICNSPLTSNKIQLRANPFAVNEIHIGNAQGISDSEVIVPISMNNMDAINGFTLEMEIPDALEYVNESFTLSNRSQGHQFQANMVDKQLKINVFSLQNKTFTGFNGVIASFKVRLKGKGRIQLNPSKASLGAFYKGTIQNVLSAYYGGTINISYPSISLNKQLNFGRTPITQTSQVNLPINNYGSAPLSIEKVLINNSNVVITNHLPLVIPAWQQENLTLEIRTKNEGKIEGLLQIYSNDPSQRMVNVNFTGERYSPNLLKFSTTEIPQNNKSLKISVDLSNYNSISGLQFDLHYPNGVVAKDEITFSNRTAGFSMNHRKIASNTDRYFIYSLSGKSIASGEGKVFDLLFDITPQLNQGTHQLRVTQIKLSTPLLEEKHSQLEDLIFTLPVTAPFYPIQSIHFKNPEVNIRLDETVKLTTIIQPENASNKTLKWSSSDNQTATVDQEGKIYPLKTGKVIITATTTDGSNLSTHCTVNIQKPLAKSITVQPTSLLLKVREITNLKTSITPIEAEQSVTYTSNKPEIATVDPQTGKVTAIALGNAIITAQTTDGTNLTATCSITVEPTPAETVTLNKQRLTMKAKQTEILNANVLPETTTEKTVSWKSSDEAVATVDQSGKVTAVAVGNATITATCGSASATCEITVETTPAETVTLNKQRLTMKAKQTEILNANVLPETTTEKTVSWKSSDEAVATVDQSGKVTAVAVGNATITATCGSASATCEITVETTPAETVTLNKQRLTMKAKQTEILNANVLPETTTEKTVSWKSSDEAVATVDQSGKVTAVAVGNATITATCGSASATCEITVEPTPAETVTLNKQRLTMKAKQTEILNANVLPETTTEKTVSWKSSDEAVATVDQSGKVTAVAVGNATITATCGSASATCEITVEPTPAETVTLNKQRLTMKAKQTEILNANVLPETTTEKTVSWKSSDEAVATVDQSGKVTAVAVGNATITATCGSASATCEITVETTPAETVTLNKQRLTMKAKQTEILNANVLPETTTEKTVSWKSSDEAVATVDQSGKVTAVAVGNATITATCGSASATCEITVEPTPAETVTLNKQRLTMKAKQTEILNANVLPETTTEKTVSWKSSDEAVATVDQSGKVTAVAVGNATITATCGSASATCEITVETTPAETVTLNKQRLTMKAKQTEILNANVLPETTTEKTVSWKSSDEAVATVDQSGKVTAVAVGNATITATCGSASATCEITVETTPAETVTLNKQRLTMKAKQTEILNANVLPETTTEKTVSWKSSDEAVATVDQSGKVTAVAVGNATITATCGSASATCEITVEPTPAETVTLNKQRLTMKAKQTEILNANVLPETTTEKTISWKSSDEAVATVDQSGKVTAVAVGNATITATCGSASATCEITVEPTPAETVTLNKQRLTMKAKQTEILNANVLPETTTEKTVSWKSSDEAVATVDQSGKVTAVAVGNATITATCGSASATCEITVETTPAETVTLNKQRLTMKAKQTEILNANVLPETTTEKTVSWKSSDEAVATVDQSGKVTAVAVGNATITATCGSASATCEITVETTPAETVTLNKQRLTMKAKQTEILNANVLPETTTEKTVSWKSSDEAVATVDQSGKVTAVAVGNATITATCGSASATCEITVETTPATSIELNNSEIIIEVNETFQLTATILPENATDQSVIWTSSNDKIASVDETGMVTAIQQGKTTVTATNSSGQTATCTVEVKDPCSITEIEINTPNKTMIYNINGVQMNTDYNHLTPGLYIINGKKVFKQKYQ